MIFEHTLHVKVKTTAHTVIGIVEERNLIEFNNGLDSTLRVRNIQGQTKGTDYHRDQVQQVTRQEGSVQ